MTKLLSFIFAFALAFALPACVADTQPEAFVKTWEALRTAVLADKIDEASTLTHFPLRSIDHGHKEVKSVAVFKQRFKKIFEPAVVELIKTGQCETGKGDPGYEANCGNGYMIFGFAIHDGRYQLSYFGSINE